MNTPRLFIALALVSGPALAGESASAPFLAALNAAFPAWDTDHDGSLSPVEIDTALADPRTTGDAAAALAVVKRLERGKDWKSIPRTLASLTALAAPHERKDGPRVTVMFEEGQKRVAKSRPELFTEGAPLLSKLHQGQMGNCFSLAPLGAMLDRDPAQVRSMFKDNADGTFDVKIGARTVHVAAPTQAEVALSSSNESTGLWSNVYEKAAGIARNDLRPEKDRAGTPLDAIASGGSAGTMLAFITGNEMERFTLKWAKSGKTSSEETESKLKELRGKLQAAFAEHRCVTTGTLKPTMHGLHPGHAYGVIGYVAATDEIRVWDPHGDNFTPASAPGPEAGYARKNGICNMPLPVFAKQFAGLAFELQPKS